MATKPKYYFTKLPCKPYIKKYIASFYGLPVPASNKTTLGCFVNSCLAKERYRAHYYGESFIYKNFTDYLVFQISGWAFMHIGFDFPKAKVIEINQFLEARFEEHMFLHCNTHYIAGQTERRKLIEAFAESHGIELEEDISLDALVKTERRMRNAIKRVNEEKQQQPVTS